LLSSSKRSRLQRLGSKPYACFAGGRELLLSALPPNPRQVDALLERAIPLHFEAHTPQLFANYPPNNGALGFLVFRFRWTECHMQALTSNGMLEVLAVIVTIPDNLVLVLDITVGFLYLFIPVALSVAGILKRDDSSFADGFKSAVKAVAIGLRWPSSFLDVQLIELAVESGANFVWRMLPRLVSLFAEDGEQLLLIVEARTD
jgi:hypothetical protein